MFKQVPSCLFGLLLWFLCSPGKADNSERLGPYQEKHVDGWNVRVHETLLQEKSVETQLALKLIRSQLERLSSRVPASVVQEMKKVPIWISPEYPGKGPSAEYHPNARWLKENGRDERLLNGVELTNTRIFERENLRMPMLMLHEMVHAYHDLVLDFEKDEIKKTYQNAKDSGKYEHVRRWTGEKYVEGEKAYALTNHKEYFAETSEAYFGRNDFEPFDAKELKDFDPAGYELMRSIWGDLKTADE